MKIKRIVYRTDTFTDFSGMERPVTMCAASIIADKDLPFCKGKILSIGIAIGHPNDKDIWDEKKGKSIAFNKALSCNGSFLCTNDSGLISSELVDVLLNREMEHFKKDPGLYIAAYNDAKKKYEKKLEVEEMTTKLKEKLSKINVNELPEKTRERLFDLL